MNEGNNFVDILKARNSQFGIIRFMSRSWIPKKTLTLDKCYTPQELKDLVVNSVFMDTFLNAESTRQGVPLEQVKKEMLEYLNEMAFDKKIHIVRWVGIAFLKICFMMKIGVYVNEPVVLTLRETMGNSPVLFLPTHRSYADFCLMTYLCFHYDIDIPAVAAGIDFYSMALVGERLREMCAFYIRRTLAGAPLYAATLRQYVRNVVAHHSAPLEFFLEGTRSRSNKSLHPRYGMMSMALLPYFAREVSDVTIVPVNITYDRLVELTLFSFEHLGVPKPQETTEGLIKSLQNLNDHYGNVYVTLGTPISVNEFLNRDVPNTEETSKPVDLQVLTPEQTKMVHDIAHQVVASHQKCTMVTVPMLMSVVLMQCLLKNRSMHLDDVMQEMQWFMEVFTGLGAQIVETDLMETVEKMLVVHRRMFFLDADKHFKLVAGTPFTVTSEVQAKMKGHLLKEETMMTAIPVIELQTYVNPVLHYLVPPGLIFLITRGGVRDTEECLNTYLLLRKLLLCEFFCVIKTEHQVFPKALEYCVQNGVVVREGNSLTLGTNEKLQYLLEWALLPALTTLTHCVDALSEGGHSYIRSVQKAVQARSEARGDHPYSLSIDLATHCVQGLGAAGALRFFRREQGVQLEAFPDVLRRCGDAVRAVPPQIRADFGAGNSAVASRAPVASRL